MINLIISIILAAASWILVSLFFDSTWAGVIPFIFVLVISFLLLNRRIMRKLAPEFDNVKKILENLPKLPSEQARTYQLNKAVDILKRGYRYKNYQFLLAANLNAQIGTLYYLQNRLKDARPYLAKAIIQDTNACAMYACILYRDNDEKGMRAAFEKTLKLNKKIPLVWNLYAWCLMQMKKRDDAIDVLNRGLAANPGDAIITENIDLAKNSAKIKMRPYNEQWYQFRLENPPMMKMNPMMDRRAMRAK